MKGHTQKDCKNPWIRYIGCNRNHRANDQKYSRYQLVPLIADTPSSLREMDISSKDINQEELIQFTESLNISRRSNLLKESAKTLGYENIDLVVVPIVIVSDILNTEGEG